MKKQHLKNTAPNPFYENLADDPFYIFLKKETFLFDLPHHHESVELVYMIRGRATAHLGGETYPLEEGDIFISNPQQVHFYENDTSEKLAFCLILSNKYTHDFRQIHSGSTFPALLTDKRRNGQIYSLLQQWFDVKDKTFLTDCAYANLLLDTLIKLYGFSDAKSHSATNTTAIKLINYVNDHYGENLTLEAVAQYFGYSKEYFSKLFKRTVGVNFLSFLNTTRVQRASELLNDPEQKLSIQEVCTACGFNNPVSLYRNLKKMKNAR